MQLTEDKVQVVFIAGEGRSGSTLLDRVLGQSQGFVSCGEMWLSWERAFGDNQLCGCNQHFEECAFWKDVMKTVLSKKPLFDAKRISFLQKRIMRIRYIPYLLFPKIRPMRYIRLLDEYGNLVRSFYSAILSVSGKTAIVDSSKIPIYGILLNAIGLDVRVIHLVRNSNAVTYSWRRRRIRPEITDRIEFMPQLSVIYSVILWIKANITSELLRNYVQYGTLLRYEDFTEKPQIKVEETLSMLGFDKTELPFIDEHSIKFGDNHIISGNPMRFLRGKIIIKNDDEWRKKIRPVDRWIITILTWPFLRWYGY